MGGKRGIVFRMIFCSFSFRFRRKCSEQVEIEETSHCCGWAPASRVPSGAAVYRQILTPFPSTSHFFSICTGHGALLEICAKETKRNKNQQKN